MINFETLFPENLYHSYVVEGEPDIVASQLHGYLSKQSSDILFQKYDSLNIADCSYIKEWHNTKGNTSGKRMCILSVKFINREAEQALLKMIEEPALDTHFFLVVPNRNNLLDTIRSRTHTIRISQDSVSKLGQEFLALQIKDRLEMVAKLMEAHKDDEDSGGRRYEATNLLNAIEKVIYEKLKNNKNDESVQFALGEIEKGRTYLSTPGASVKMILEHIALVI